MSVEKNSSPPELNRQTMIQYLLGELPLAWQEHFEEQFFTDQESFAQLKLVEDQLVDDYVSQALPEAQRTRFETHYLNSDRRRQKLKFAQTLKQTLAELVPVAEKQTSLSLWQSFVAAWRMPSLRYSFAALAVIAVVIGGWLLRESLRLQRERQQLEAERAALAKPTAPSVLVATPEMTPGAIPNPTPSPAPTSSPSPKPSEGNATTLLSLVLSPGSFRSDEATARTIAITPQTKVIHLQLALKGQELYPAYRVVIETSSGQTIWTRNEAHSVKVGPNNFIVLAIPIHSLPANDYILTLSGKKDSAFEEIDDYQFRVVKRP